MILCTIPKNPRANTVLSKFKHCSLQIKCLLLDSYCLSFYGSHLWSVYSKTNLNKVCVYNNIYLRVLGYRRRDSASTTFVCNEIDTFEVRLCKAARSFKRRLQQSSNTIVSCLNNNGWIVSNYMHRNWDGILYI